MPSEKKTGTIGAAPSSASLEILAFAIAMGGAAFDVARASDDVGARWLGHLVAGLAGTLLLARAARWDLTAIGFTRAARPSWRYWRNVGLIALTVIGAAAFLKLVAIGALSDPSRLRSRLEIVDGARVVELLLIAPVVEEIIYRLCICGFLARPFGNVLGIVLSSLVFMLIHLLRGNLDISNALAGLLFGWAFLASESLVVPTLFHSAGNFLYLTSQCIAAAALGYPVTQMLFTWKFQP